MIEAISIKNFTNSAGDLLLTLADPESSQGFAVVEMEGLGPVDAQYSSNDWVTIDGSNITSLRLSKREINMELRFIPTRYSESIADIRKKSYLYFPIKGKIGMTFTCVNYFGVKEQYYIEGIVTKNSPTIWSKDSGAELTIICPDPYFSSVDYTEENFAQSAPRMLFPFADDKMELTENEPYQFPVSEKLSYSSKIINNISTIDIGVQVTFTAHGTVKNPAFYNETTNERFVLDYTMSNGESITIDTRKGHRRVTLNEGLGKNFVASMNLSSDWVRLVPGENIIGISCESGFDNLEISYKTIPLYVGI